MPVWAVNAASRSWLNANDSWVTRVIVFGFDGLGSGSVAVDDVLVSLPQAPATIAIQMTNVTRRVRFDEKTVVSGIALSLRRHYPVRFEGSVAVQMQATLSARLRELPGRGPKPNARPACGEWTARIGMFERCSYSPGA